MDYDKLIEQAIAYAKADHPVVPKWAAIVDKKKLKEYATAISDLQDKNRKLQDDFAHVTAERDALIEDFVDYVTNGVPNPAIFCKNRCNKCVDMRGWCTGKDCKGFYPSVVSGQKEG